MASGIKHMIEFGKLGQIYHFSTNEFVTIQLLVEKICDLVGVPFDDFVVNTGDRTGKDAAYLMNSEKARVELGWSPMFSLDSGLRSTHDWVKQHIGTLESMPLDYKHRI